MGDVPYNEGGWVGRVKKLSMGDFEMVTYPFILSETSSKGNFFILGYAELTWAADGQKKIVGLCKRCIKKLPIIAPCEKIKTLTLMLFAFLRFQSNMRKFI